MNDQAAGDSGIGRFFRAIGPAIIVASVVLGPGSIAASSKVGAAYGYRMVWVVLLAAGLMMGMVAMAARLGVVLEGTLCDELAARISRPFAALVGLTIFFVCAGFQFGNNLGVLAALDPWLAEAGDTPKGGLFTLSNGIVFLLNTTIVAFLFGSRSLYKPIERLMMLLVGLMIVAFVGNLLYLLAVGQPEAQVSPAGERTLATDADKGESAEAKPQLPTAAARILAVLGLIGTTFSVAGAFYHSYLVREKGWTLADLRRGLIDSVAGISVLATITLVIMVTAAISFAGRGVELKNAADVARQLEPLFGRAALILFSLGIFAAAFSSFLINALIGGAMLSDGFGLGGSMDGMPTKFFTALALATGMIVAMFVPPESRFPLLVFAQAMVVIGFPLLAGSLLFLATRPDLKGPRNIPAWMKLIATVGLLVVLASAVRVVMAIASNW